MKLNNISIRNSIKEAEELLEKEQSISLLKKEIKVLITILKSVLIYFGTNSRNSSTPPSGDKDRKRGGKNNKTRRPKGT